MGRLRARQARWVWGVGAVLALVGCCLSASASASASGAPAPAAQAMPFSGTWSASPFSQIILPGLAPRRVHGLIVRGSRSGIHTGQLEALPGHRGTAFIPATRFRLGETVTVTLGKQTITTFTIAVPAPGVLARVRRAQPRTARTGSAKPPTVQTFVSRPDLRPPTVSFSTTDPDLKSGDIFLDVQHGAQVGPMILSPQGNLVWFSPLTGGNAAFDVRVQRYQGKPVLTYWVGQQAGTHGGGTDEILDTAYRTVATVRAAEGYVADLHEFLITPQNTALITSYAVVHADLRSVGGPRNGEVYDCVLQEVDIATGRLLWEWHSLGHVRISDSYAGKPYPGQPYDYFHLNSIQQLRDGALLISARNTWAVYLISRRTGQFLWEVGGKHSTYSLTPGARFEWQHDAELQPDGDLTLFDDESPPARYRQSRAVALRLDPRTHIASLRRLYLHAPPLVATSQGSMQTLANGNVFVGWGAQPAFSEYSASGRQLFSARFPGSVVSYRAYRFVWNAQPATPPMAAVRPGQNGQVTVYASWNGATNVAYWQLMAGPSPSQLSPVAVSASTGFETSIPTQMANYFEVNAVDSSLRVLGSSAPIPG
jgi:hypothetical protein